MYSKKLWGIWVKYYKCKYLFPNCSNSKCTMTAFDSQLIINAFINKISFPTPPTFSRSTWHPKSGCHVTSLCQGLRRSAGSGDEDPENVFHDVFLSHAVGEVNPTVCTSSGILNRLPLFIHFFSDPLCCLHYHPGIKLGKS